VLLLLLLLLVVVAVVVVLVWVAVAAAAVAPAVGSVSRHHAMECRGGEVPCILGFNSRLTGM
jgi:hypothetical protein